ncbi:MAG: hypothetical protein BWK73_10390 [Thiothrix lacustris]|uniref:Conjugal transfer protein TraG n=1 Tax=Thiothrix lacustris TaxID=525917 RepID=A0A1Y1QUH5_9GAMM|nr:MAG: hypothetical protein BWK73_10390 [Thiothrix lacustris]
MSSDTGIGVSQPEKEGSALNRILLNLIFFVVITVINSAAVTQWVAHQLHYHPTLGGQFHDHYYYPWSWVFWAETHWHTHHQLMQTALTGFATGMALAFTIFAIGRLFIRRTGKAVEGLHGTAHWASRKDIVTAGLLPTKPTQPHPGVYVGGWYNPKTKAVEYCRHDGPEHVLAFAPTRSGKGVGLVLPTLLSWPGSCIVYDLKGENWALTAGWRQQHANNYCLKFDPTAKEGCARFNPLAEIRLGTDFETKDAQNIAGMIADPEGKGLNDHWAKTSYSLLTALILHICYVRKAEGTTANMGDIDAVLTESGDDVEAVFKAMKEYPHHDGKPHPLVAKEAEALIKTPEKERGSIISTAVSFLKLYNDPVVRANVSESHWEIDDLMNLEKPVSLYFVVPPSDRDRLLPLIRLMITMITKKLTEKMEFKDGKSVAHYKHRMLMLLDEFASMKRLSAIEDALSFSAGYGVKFYLIIQDVDQIDKNEMYGRENGIMGNCHIRIAYAPNKQSTADLLSKLSGVTTVIKKQITTSGKRHSLSLGQVSESWQETSRPLITADEVMRLPAMKKDKSGVVTESGHMLIFVAGQVPVYGRQILYFLDPVFQARAKVIAPTSSDRISMATTTLPAITSPAAHAAPAEEAFA